RLHLVLICPHTAPEMAVFGITKLDYVSQISFATRDLSVRNPNAIALPVHPPVHTKKANLCPIAALSR
ncbi:MAG: hypothetical protein P4K94_09375, partial [Terracidiphilus sp.]|nr:hypothetical protein [Terracidiphilus sp.]